MEYKFPTYRSIAEPVSMFGVPPEHAAFAFMIAGGFAFVPFLMHHPFVAFLTALTLTPIIFSVLKMLAMSDYYWYEHLTTHKWTADWWIGK